MRYQTRPGCGGGTIHSLGYPVILAIRSRSSSDAQRRWYRLRPEPLAEIDAWLTPYRRMWHAGLDALERHLDAMPDDAMPDDDAMSDDTDGEGTR